MSRWEGMNQRLVPVLAAMSTRSVCQPNCQTSNHTEKSTAIVRYVGTTSASVVRVIGVILKVYQMSKIGMTAETKAVVCCWRVLNLYK
ncbi:hypothetical protein B0H17DRAFT_1101722 [Mycena rosella]|uniref:Uncharacterized protein n=1 Tax=Mycena rosella TaxID=1033263 RepID=A0AAD7CLM1_MYCRO|nr:hypothetical protein B0H17DRAFT_1101722 [Mycena rosella]